MVVTGSAARAMTDALNDNPSHRHLNMVKGPEITNIRIRSINQRLASWESMGNGETAESWARHLAAYDVQETAEVANNVLRLVNRLAAEK